MARPTKSPEEQRNVPIKFWGTKSEAIYIDDVAESLELDRSGYMRLRCLGVEPRRKKASAERKALITALAQLGHIRSDINQLLKDRLAHKFVDGEQVQRSLERLETTADNILDVLERW